MSKNSVPICFCASDQMIEQIKHAAEQHGLSVSAFIRELFRQYQEYQAETTSPTR